MQREIAAGSPARPVHLLGVNISGLESWNESFTAGLALPWLQDTVSENVWEKWAVTWRDVFILDAENKVAGIYNLTEHPLEVRANYETLRNMLLAAAAR